MGHGTSEAIDVQTTTGASACAEVGTAAKMQAEKTAETTRKREANKDRIVLVDPLTSRHAACLEPVARSRVAARDPSGNVCCWDAAHDLTVGPFGVERSF
jgi:hypothetical protein